MTMEEDLEEEQLNYEAAMDKTRKAEEQVDNMNSSIAQHQSNVAKLESTKSQLEKQVKGCCCFLVAFILSVTSKS